MNARLSGRSRAVSAISRSRTASLAALSAGCGRWSPRMTCKARRARARVELAGALRRADRRRRDQHGPCPPARRAAERAITAGARIAIAPHPVPPCPREMRDAISLSAAACDRRGAPASGENEMGYRVAVVGATGNVGREILNILAERQFPLDEVAAVASRALDRRRHRFRRQRRGAARSRTSSISISPAGTWPCSPPARKCRKVYAPKAAAAGCTVIDN